MEISIILFFFFCSIEGSETSVLLNFWNSCRSHKSKIYDVTALNSSSSNSSSGVRGSGVTRGLVTREDGKSGFQLKAASRGNDPIGETERRRDAASSTFDVLPERRRPGKKNPIQASADSLMSRRLKYDGDLQRDGQ